MLKRLPVYDQVVKLAHFVHFVLKFIGMLVFCIWLLIWIYSNTSKRYTCLYLSPGLVMERRRWGTEWFRPKWSYLEDNSNFFLSVFIFGCAGSLLPLRLLSGCSARAPHCGGCFFFFLICSEFCHTLKWNGLEFTCLPHPDPPSHLPLHPLPPGLPRAPVPSACIMHRTWAGDLFLPW